MSAQRQAEGKAGRVSPKPRFPIRALGCGTIPRPGGESNPQHRAITEFLDAPLLFSLAVLLDNKTRVEENGATPAAHW
jgi:hypothetical protein